MADNFVTNAGSGGSTFAADDISGVLHQRVKATWGPDGTANDTDDATNKRLPVKVGEALPAGTNAIGKLAANSGVDIGDVDVTSVPAPLSSAGGGTEAAALRVTLANDSTGLVSVDDNGGTLSVDDGAGSLTVDGTVAATQSGTWNVTNVSGTLSLPTGASTLAEQQSQTTALQLIDDVVHADDAALGKVSAIGAMFDDTSPGTTTENRIRPVRMSTRRELYHQIRDAAGNERGVNVTAGNALVVDGSGATQPVSGTVTANAGTNLNTSALALEAGGNLAGAATSLAILDDWDESDRAKVNPIAGQAGVQGGSGAVSALTQRVVLATDVALPAGTNAIGKLAANSGVDIGDVDITSITPGTAPANLGKAEDAGHSSGDVGVMPLAVRQDANATLAGTDLDYAPLQVDATGNLKVAIISGAGSGGTAIADGATFTADTTSLTPIGGYRDDTAPATVTEGDAAACRITTNRALHVNLRDAAGAEVAVGGGTQYTEDAAAAADPVGTMALAVRADSLAAVTSADGDNIAARATNKGELYVKHADAIPVTDNAGSLTVDGSVSLAAAIPAGTNNIGDVDVLSLVPGTGATSLGKAEDAVHSSGDTGVMALSVRQDTAAALSGTDADYQPLITDASGRLHVNVGNTVTVGAHAVTNAGTFAVQESGAALTALQLIDDPVVADDAAFTPGTTKVMVAGFEADESSTDSVDEGDAGAARMTLDRKVIVAPQPHSAGGCSIFRSLDLDETEEDVKTSAGCVYGVWFTNTATATRWLKFYNATAANVTVGSTTPVITLGLPGNSSDDISGNLGPGGVGINFDTAICVAATTGVADADTGAPGANEVICNVFYK